MRFIYWGQFSGGIEVHSAMGVGFRGREPSSDVSDPAAVAWLSGNPLFEAVPDAEPEKRKHSKKVAGDVPEKPAKQERGKQRRKKMDKDDKAPAEKPQEGAPAPAEREAPAPDVRSPPPGGRPF